MSNLTRYDLGGYDCGQTCTACGMEVSTDGEYVKFDDIKELLNSSHSQPKFCPYHRNYSPCIWGLRFGCKEGVPCEARAELRVEMYQAWNKYKKFYN